jgi:hypothetical protein
MKVRFRELEKRFAVGVERSGAEIDGKPPTVTSRARTGLAPP